MRRHSLALAGAGLAVVALRCSTSTAQPTAPTTTWAEPPLTRYPALRMTAYDLPPLGGKARRDAGHGTRKKVPSRLHNNPQTSADRMWRVDHCGAMHIRWAGHLRFIERRAEPAPYQGA